MAVESSTNIGVPDAPRFGAMAAAEIAVRLSEIAALISRADDISGVFDELAMYQPA